MAHSLVEFFLICLGGVSPSLSLSSWVFVFGLGGWGGRRDFNMDMLSDVFKAFPWRFFAFLGVLMLAPRVYGWVSWIYDKILDEGRPKV